MGTIAQTHAKSSAFPPIYILAKYFMPMHAAAIVRLAKVISPTFFIIGSVLSLFRSFACRATEEKTAAATFAAASPEASNLNISATESAKFTAIDAYDILTGVLVSLFEWKPRVAYAVNAKNGSPATDTHMTGKHMSTSFNPKSPHLKSRLKISRERARMPNIAGIAIANVAVRPSEYSLLNEFRSPERKFQYSARYVERRRGRVV